MTRSYTQPASFKLALARRGRRSEAGEPIGQARVDRRTKDLAARLVPGEIAVIDHADLDPVAAQSLVRAGAAGVVNAARSVTGRYPNLGPLVLIDAGIPLIDDLGSGLMDFVEDGQIVEFRGSSLWRGDVKIAEGQRQSRDSLEAQIDAARVCLGAEFEAFAENTLKYLGQEMHLLTDALPIPDLATPFAGRQVLIVVRGPDAAADLAALRPYISELRPIIVGVDGGADVILAAGLSPDLVVGDFDSVTTAALMGRSRKFARSPGNPPELMVHAYTDGRAPGAERLDGLGLPYITFEAPGTSEDVAMLVAFEKGAELIVAVGTHASMVDFLDKGRAGMSSTFLVRLKVGPVLVDAKGVSRLYRNQVRTRDMLLLVGAALFAMMVMVLAFSPLHVFARTFLFTLGEQLRALVRAFGF